MVQGKGDQGKPDQGQRGTRNLERTDTQEEITDAPGRQQGNKGHRWETATLPVEGEDSREQYQRLELRTAIIPGKQRKLKKPLYEISGSKIMKQMLGTSIRMRKMRNWTLWRGRPPLKRKKNLLVA
jgi:hypothetical protein